MVMSKQAVYNILQQWRRDVYFKRFFFQCIIYEFISKDRKTDFSVYNINVC